VLAYKKKQLVQSVEEYWYIHCKWIIRPFVFDSVVCSLVPIIPPPFLGQREQLVICYEMDQCEIVKKYYLP
jgi:hypothetical protein